jgi:excisionase family DNA binding protein
MSKKNRFYRDEEPAVPPLALSSVEAAAAISVSLSTLERLTRSGAISACRVGRCRRYRVETLDAFLRSCEDGKNGGQA